MLWSFNVNTHIFLTAFRAEHFYMYVCIANVQDCIYMYVYLHTLNRTIKNWELYQVKAAKKATHDHLLAFKVMRFKSHSLLFWYHDDDISLVFNTLEYIQYIQNV